MHVLTCYDRSDSLIRKVFKIVLTLILGIWDSRVFIQRLQTSSRSTAGAPGTSRSSCGGSSFTRGILLRKREATCSKCKLPQNSHSFLKEKNPITCSVVVATQWLVVVLEIPVFIYSVVFVTERRLTLMKSWTLSLMWSVRPILNLSVQQPVHHRCLWRR